MTEAKDPFTVIETHQRYAPVDVDKIASDLGIKVYKEDLGEEVFGKFSRNRFAGGPAGYAIYVNATAHPNRQRFTLAHELAHFVLHRDLMGNEIVDYTMYRSDLPSQYETQANRLAADILMPWKLLKKALRDTRDIARLAQLFGVSKTAMEIRLKSLPAGFDASGEMHRLSDASSEF